MENPAAGRDTGLAGRWAAEESDSWGNGGWSAGDRGVGWWRSWRLGEQRCWRKPRRVRKTARRVNDRSCWISCKSSGFRWTQMMIWAAGDRAILVWWNLATKFLCSCRGFFLHFSFLFCFPLCPCIFQFFSSQFIDKDGASIRTICFLLSSLKDAKGLNSGLTWWLSHPCLLEIGCTVEARHVYPCFFALFLMKKEIHQEHKNIDNIKHEQ